MRVRPVPGGTVDFMTTTRSWSASCEICSTTARTALRSADPVAAIGVPTATNTTSPSSGVRPLLVLAN